MNVFYQDIKRGLTSQPKRLYSKYFYDKAGDILFQKLMHSPEYYLSRCELEILKNQSTNIVASFVKNFNDFDLIELGAGDASKSIFLIRALLENKAVNFTYYPIDISSNIIDHLERELPKQLPNLKIKGLNGEYIAMLKQHTEESEKPKVVLFLGANIGNIGYSRAIEFCRSLHDHLNKGDLILIGFDLKKDPEIVLAAYNDKEGLTRDFNLNLLKRINEELNGNFDLNAFSHYPCYDPETGECKSYLISKAEQKVVFGNNSEKVTVHFQENEAIFMEVSKKYSLEEIKSLADSTAFKITNHFLDSKKWFVDSLWAKED